ncbi:Nif3-like dinuclear metal center hexameric protein [Fulvivirga sp. RKSG066]|uniref:Nif3-like dinuclear metal center hexameric protein n=1 Tax=Fulvivirga aurantia TaxID=2529383 RepID=UPI0012BBCAD2|nr:Nif3-like dinuclear metal center hexameric protein [Fulvivirga aurantia]MTI22801.1 Nif3-like dinuclear metal center hexameric protein [Fulvivirga aurantia]
MTKIKDLVSYLASIAPPSYQESYDNSGLITGDANAEVKGVLVSLDCIESIVDEAIEKDCNVIVAHHPIVFKGLKSFTGKDYVERTVIKAIKNDIAIYAIHTNLDNVLHGVNAKIGEKIGISNPKILAPKKQLLSKLVAFIPQENKEAVLDAIYKAGAGEIGNYSNCSFTTTGKGTFKPNESADPHIGKQGEAEEVTEDRIEVMMPSHLENRVIGTLKKAHPYEEVAYYITQLQNENQEVGSGMYGDLDQPMEPFEFLNYLKDRMALNCIRHTAPSNKKIKRVAWCGGAGSFLLKKAISQQADVFITGDFKYHEFFDAEDKIMIADIGHYESEVFTKELLYEILTKKFTTFATNLSEIVTNPISYL